ncbi:AAA family ATPase, partial [Clostridioides difficile]|nr:AAA family ATPase [Clostridioides difficile]
MIDQAQILRKMAMEKRGLDEIIVENENTPKIITIASGKGGVGKSNLATNLSICLTKLNKKVLILDADIGMSNIDIIMGVNVKGTIIDVINGEKNIEDIISQTKYGVNIISGGSALNHIEDFTEAQRNKFIHSIEQIHDVDFIIIDTGAGMSKSLLSFI